jgi:hypothetical protein
MFTIALLVVTAPAHVTAIPVIANIVACHNVLLQPALLFFLLLCMLLVLLLVCIAATFVTRVVAIAR